MSKVDEAELVRLLVAAQRAGSKPLVDLQALDDFDLQTGYRVSLAQQELLGEEVALYKTVLRNDGLPAVASPIWKSRVGDGQSEYHFPPGFDIIGLEFEVGVKLAHNIPLSEDIDDSSIEKAIEYYFLGVEIVGTRLNLDNDATRTPTPAQALADQNTALGYVIGGKCTRGPDILGLPVSFEINGKEIDRKPAVPGCGTILASLVAYAKAQQPQLPLKAGTIITPGALSGLVQIPKGASGHVVGRLGDEQPVEFWLQ